MEFERDTIINYDTVADVTLCQEETLESIVPDACPDIMRIVDVMLSFPFIFLALCLMAVLGSSMTNVILVLGVTGWVPYARTIRAQVLSVREREFVVAARISGARKGYIIFKHILPNVIDSAIILGTLEMGNAILSEASLTFLGMGIPHNRHLGKYDRYWP